jgi:hypothetical protein
MGQMSARGSTTSAIHDGLHQVAQLLSRELIAFEVSCQSAFAIDDCGMQRMVHEPFIRKIVHSKQVADVLNVGHGTGKEMPGCRVGFPVSGVLFEDIRIIPLRIESNGEQYQFSTHPRLKPLLEYAEVIGVAEAEVWQRTTRIDKVYGDNFADELRECGAQAILVRQCKIGRTFPDFQAEAGAGWESWFSNFNRRAVSGSCSPLS